MPEARNEGSPAERPCFGDKLAVGFSLEQGSSEGSLAFTSARPYLPYVL